jgi:hypothetical protein
MPGPCLRVCAPACVDALGALCTPFTHSHIHISHKLELQSSEQALNYSNGVQDGARIDECMSVAAERACFVVACVGVLVRAPACIEAAPPSPMHARARVLMARAASASSHIGMASTAASQLRKLEKGGDAVLLGLKAKNPTASARELLRLVEVLPSMRRRGTRSAARTAE